jgi:hypothetical protein
MIRKSGVRFSEKIMLQLERDRGDAAVPSALEELAFGRE